MEDKNKLNEAKSELRECSQPSEAEMREFLATNNMSVEDKMRIERARVSHISPDINRQQPRF